MIRVSPAGCDSPAGARSVGSRFATGEGAPRPPAKRASGGSRARAGRREGARRGRDPEVGSGSVPGDEPTRPAAPARDGGTAARCVPRARHGTARGDRLNTNPATGAGRVREGKGRSGGLRGLWARAPEGWGGVLGPVYVAPAGLDFRGCPPTAIDTCGASAAGGRTGRRRTGSFGRCCAGLDGGGGTWLDDGATSPSTSASSRTASGPLPPTPPVKPPTRASHPAGLVAPIGPWIVVAAGSGLRPSDEARPGPEPGGRIGLWVG